MEYTEDLNYIDRLNSQIAKVLFTMVKLAADLVT